LGDHVRDAEPRPGGDPAAHHDGVLSGVRGVLALADGLVSWGGDGANLFWTLASSGRAATPRRTGAGSRAFWRWPTGW
jgi:hypothetical protein